MKKFIDTLQDLWECALPSEKVLMMVALIETIIVIIIRNFFGG